MPNKILIKISGKSFLNKTSNFNFDYLESLVEQIICIKNTNKKIVIVVGGGNICRGNELAVNFPNDFDIRPLDYAGMIATVVNGIILQTIFRKKKIEVGLLNAFDIDVDFIDKYSKEKATEILNQKKIIILTSGKGEPKYSTDILITEKAKELDIDLILLGKYGVSGIYLLNPSLNNVKKSDFLKKTTFNEIIKKKLEIIDLSAAKIGEKLNNLEMIVFNIKNNNAIINAFERKGEFTYVNNSE